MRPFNPEIAAAVTIRIDVDGRVLLQFFGMVFRPFGGTKQHGFLAVPSAINDGAFRLPSSLEKDAESTRLFQKSDLAGDGIFRAVHPSIVMIAANNPLIGRFGA